MPTRRRPSIRRLYHNSSALALAGSLMFVAINAQADEISTDEAPAEEPAASDEPKPGSLRTEIFPGLQTLVYAGPAFYLLARTDKTFTGTGGQVGVTQGLGDSWGFGIAWKQALSRDEAGTGIITLFSAFDARLTYAITGNYRRRKTTTWQDGGDKSEGVAIVRGLGARPQGLRFGISTAQYFVAARTSSVPYSGIGALLYYDFPWGTFAGFSVGVQSERVVNGPEKLTSTAGFLNLSVEP